ncbi:MAG: F0F1 ATP synthase subunit B [Christensenellales bacterium]
MPEINILKVGLHILNVLVMFVVLRVLIYKPVLKYIKKREHAFLDKVDNLNEREKTLTLQKEQYERLMADAQNEAAALITKSSKLSKEHEREVLDSAKERAKDMMVRARKEIDAEKAQALLDMRTDIAELGVQIAKKVIEREITIEDNRKIIDEFYERMG